MVCGQEQSDQSRSRYTQSSRPDIPGAWFTVIQPGGTAAMPTTAMGAHPPRAYLLSSRREHRNGADHFRPILLASG